MNSAQILYKTLEEKILNLLKKECGNSEYIYELQKEIEKLHLKISELITINEELKYTNETLKITSVMGGNDEHRKLMKLKINSLVKEIDKCIQLVDYTS